MGTGKKRIEIKKIVNDRARMVTFSKRRQGLFKKAHEYAAKTGSLVAVLVFSPAGRPFVHGSPSFDAVMDEFVSGNGCQGGVSTVDNNAAIVEDEAGQESVWIGVGGGGYAAEVFSGLEERMRRCESVDELTQVKSVLEEMRSKLVKRLNRAEEEEFVASLFSCD